MGNQIKTQQKFNHDINHFKIKLQNHIQSTIQQSSQLIKNRIVTQLKLLQNPQLLKSIDNYQNALKIKGSSNQLILNPKQPIQDMITNLLQSTSKKIKDNAYKLTKSINHQINLEINLLIQNYNEQTRLLIEKENKQFIQQYLNQEQKIKYVQSQVKILRTILKNIQLDYPGQYTQNNLINVLELYKKAHSQIDSQNIQKIYNQQKKKLLDKEDKNIYINQLNILEWFQKQRGIKYDNNNVAGANQQLNIQSLSLPICSFTKDLVKAHVNLNQNGNKQLVNESVLLSIARVIQTQININKKQSNVKARMKQIGYDGFRLVFIKDKDKKQIETIWLAQVTQDGRFVWRSDYQVDFIDVKKLLYFILASKWVHEQKQGYRKRSEYRPVQDKNQQCPSIVINAGSHGVSTGGNAFQKGDQELFDKRIIDQTKTVVHQIIQQVKQKKFKTLLTEQNIVNKIHISEISVERHGVYPLKANHIIDTECYGAYSMVKSKYLITNNTKHVQKDLMFLYQPKPRQQLFWNSQIIQTLEDEKKLVAFFGQKLVIKDVNLLYKASLFNFDLTKYWDRCGSQTHTLFLCKTNKDKIIGAYSPLSHRWDQKDPDQTYGDYRQGWVKDSSKTSFLFSITQNDKFGLANYQKAIQRSIDLLSISFGKQEFQIIGHLLKTQIIPNQRCCYYNKKYQNNRESYGRLNGNDVQHCTTKEWEVWKINLKN